MLKKCQKLVFEKFDSIDILVNNAGFAIYGSVKDLSLKKLNHKWKQIILE